MEATSSSERPPLKRQKPSDVSISIAKEKSLTLDRISILPDSLLLHILSYLTTKYAIRTSVLSQRWQYLWTYVPVIDFSDSLNLREVGNSLYIVSLISNTLIQHQSPKLKKFLLHVEYNEEIESNIEVWLRFAKRKNVEELELEFLKVNTGGNFNNGNSEDDKNDCYDVPVNVLNNSPFVRLKLVKCGIEYDELTNWRSLRFLSLCKVALPTEMIGEILCVSPLLEFLELCECWGFKFIDIKSERMRKLVLKGYGDPSDPPSEIALKIVAPNIKTLEILGYLRTWKLSLTHSSSLVDVHFNFELWIREGMNNQLYAKNVRELLENLRDVKYLTVGIWCLKVLAPLEMETLHLLPSKLECLRVCTFLSKEEQSGIVILLSLFGLGGVPLTLVMYSTTPRCITVTNVRAPDKGSGSSVYYYQTEVVPVPKSDDVENYWTAMRKHFTAALERIKTVKFVGFTVQKSEIQLIMFLLKNARRLEKMTIHTHPWMLVDLNKSFETAQQILSTPRCSENSVVLFS